MGNYTSRGMTPEQLKDRVFGMALLSILHQMNELKFKSSDDCGGDALPFMYHAKSMDDIYTHYYGQDSLRDQCIEDYVTHHLLDDSKQQERFMTLLRNSLPFSDDLLNQIRGEEVSSVIHYETPQDSQINDSTVPVATTSDFSKEKEVNTPYVNQMNEDVLAEQIVSRISGMDVKDDELHDMKYLDIPNTPEQLNDDINSVHQEDDLTSRVSQISRISNVSSSKPPLVNQRYLRRIQMEREAEEHDSKIINKLQSRTEKRRERLAELQKKVDSSSSHDLDGMVSRQSMISSRQQVPVEEGKSQVSRQSQASRQPVPVEEVKSQLSRQSQVSRQPIPVPVEEVKSQLSRQSRVSRQPVPVEEVKSHVSRQSRQTHESNSHVSLPMINDSDIHYTDRD